MTSDGFRERPSSTASSSRCHRFLAFVALGSLVIQAGCAVGITHAPLQARPMEARALIARLLPTSVADKAGWAADIQAAFVALGLEAGSSNVCAVLAITEQESTFRANPSVPGLARIVRDEVFRRAAQAGVPAVIVRAALQLDSSNGRTYAERLDGAKTEKELSDVFVDFIGMAPLGKTLFASRNPIRTGGPMQVSIEFAERQVGQERYPYPIPKSVRDEVFTRRGGMYFGIAHLLGYPVRYDQVIFRFADYNAGRYASRNAAFQNAVSVATGLPLELDGDLIRHGGWGDNLGNTETAVRALADRLGMSNGAIRDALERGDEADFETLPLYQEVYAFAEQRTRAALPHAQIPNIKLQSPKITRPLTTDWFAHRVDDRYKRCMKRAATVSQ